MKKNNKNLMIMYFLGMCIGLIFGILFGTYIQQMIFTASMIEVVEHLNGVDLDIEVNLNETILADRMVKNVQEGIKE